MAKYVSFLFLYYTEKTNSFLPGVLKEDLLTDRCISHLQHVCTELTDILWLFTSPVAQQTTSSTPTVSSAPTNHPATNPTTHGKSNNTGLKPQLSFTLLNAAMSACSYNLGPLVVAGTRRNCVGLQLCPVLSQPAVNLRSKTRDI